MLPILFAMQLVSPLSPASVDTSNLATKVDVQAAQATANAAATPASVSAAIVAATPPDCPAPLSDALVATPGTQPKCMPKPDAQRATQVQSTTVTTSADGTFSGNWPTPFSTVPTGSWADIQYASSQATPFKCGVIATATGFSGKCWQLVTMTLPALTTALPNLVLSPFNNAASGYTVKVSGRL